MYKLLSPKKQKSQAQAMVEFALALPILLLLLYGILETGRLLFIYGSTVTAARQAARYGSATGDNGSGVPLYQDCAGIISAANKIGFVTKFENITIGYDGGVSDATGTPIHLDPPLPAPPDPSYKPACGTFTTAKNGDRIVVSVTASWEPIVPLVPLKPFKIKSTAERTILVSVAIAVTAVGGPWVPTSGPILSMVASPATYSAAGAAISYVYTITNSSSTDVLVGPFTITEPNGSTFSCAGAPDPLSASASYSCGVGTYVYYTTSTDIDNGVTPTESATALAGAIRSQPASAFATLTPLPALTLAKSVTPDIALTSGIIVTYTYTLTNTGNVPLTSLSVTDDKATVNCSGATSPLVRNASTTCTATYQITNANINQRSVTNTATATANFGATTVTSNQATATVITVPLYLTATVSPTDVTAVGQLITYTYVIQNLSASPYTNPEITDSAVGAAFTCTAGPIPANSSVTCTRTHTVTQADLDAGVPIANTVTGSAKQGPTVNTNTVALSVTVTPTPAALSLAVSVSPSGTVTSGTVTYTYTLTNTGGVTLSPTFAVADANSKVTMTACPVAALAPGATKTCTGTHVIVAADLAAGSVISKQKATAIYSGTTITSTEITTTVITFATARLDLKIVGVPSSVTGSGALINYTYTLTNTGGVALTSPYTFSNLHAGFAAPDCLLAVSPLAVGSSTTCTGLYVTTAADVTAGSVVNAAKVTVNAVLYTPSATSTVTVIGPRINVTVAGVPNPVTTLNQVVNFTYTILNDGGVTITTLPAPYFTSSLGAVNCAGATLPLVVGGSTSCVSSYTVTNSLYNAATFAYNNLVNTLTPTAPSAATSTSIPIQICDANTLKYISTNIVSGKTATWTIRNTVGVPLTISSITIAWNNSGSGGAKTQLTDVVLSGSSAGSVAGSYFYVLPATSYSVGPFTLSNNTAPAANTVITLTFSKNSPVVTKFIITFSSRPDCTVQ